MERPIRLASGRFNPLPHAGTISVFLLGIVVVTGLYITLFFSFGHAASYDAVAAMEEHPIQRTMRALHRYSSAALVLTTVVHAWRIFAAGRFTARRRRFRWLTGSASLLLVWLAGVSGYWLIWDRRAAAINELTAKLLRPFGVSDEFVVRNLIGVSPGSGSGFLLFLWFVHVFVTIAIVWFVYRHLRRSKQAWLPPRHWMALMGVGLLLISVAVPLGMLGPARPDQLVTDMPLDPFVLFLLPPLLTEWRWVAVAIIGIAGAVATGLPFLIRRGESAPVEVDEDACTGCRICVDDCPYDALTMVTRSSDRPIAELDASQCVSCGICVGSCAFDAITLPGSVSVAAKVADKTVVVMCDRHELPSPDDGRVVVPVSCSGAFLTTAVKGYLDRGATDVQLVGCAPHECRYGIGNRLATERVTGERAPHPPRIVASRSSTAWVTPDRPLAISVADTEPVEAPSGTQLLAPAAIVLLSILAVVAATRAPFRADSGDAGVRLAVDHTHGQPLVANGAVAGEISSAELFLNGASLGAQRIHADDDRSLGFVDWQVQPGEHNVQLVAAGSGTVLFDDAVTIDADSRLVVTAFDVPAPPGAEDGRNVFTSRAAGCDVCHSVREGDDGVGPSLYGVADVSAERVSGLDDEQYLRQSILLPDQYIVDGWPSGQMLPIYRERLTAEELEALLAYLLTLSGSPS